MPRGMRRARRGANDCVITMFIGSTLILGLLRDVRDSIKLIPGGKSFVDCYYSINNKLLSHLNTEKRNENT